MSEFVTKEDLNNTLSELVDNQIAREDSNARRIFDQISHLRSNVLNLEDRLYRLENPEVPEEPEDPSETITRAMVTRSVVFPEELEKGGSGLHVWQILGNVECTCSCGKALFFGLVSSEELAKVAVMRAAQQTFYPDVYPKDIMFLEVNNGMWETHQNLNDNAIIYIHESGLRARQASRRFQEVYAEKREIDAPVEKEEL